MLGRRWRTVDGMGEVDVGSRQALVSPVRPVSAAKAYKCSSKWWSYRSAVGLPQTLYLARQKTKQ